MSASHDLTFVGKRMRDPDDPYCVLTGRMFGGPAEFRVLKKNTKHLHGEHASMFVQATTPATYPTCDTGDTYVADLVHLNLTEVAGRAPTPDEFTEWGELRGHHSQPDNHGSMLTMFEVAEFHEGVS